MWSKYQISMLEHDPIRKYYKNKVKMTLNRSVAIFLFVKGVAYLKWSEYQISTLNYDPTRNCHKDDV